MKEKCQEPSQLGAIALHGGDMCLGGNQQVVKKLRAMYPFKSWKTGEGEFLGKMLKLHEKGEITNRPTA